MLKKWRFWLPAVYVGLILLMLFVSALGPSSSSEGGPAFWILLFASAPGLMVANAIGFETDFSLPLIGMVIAFQALALFLVGAAIDAVRRRKPEPILNRRILSPTAPCHAHVYYDLDTGSLSTAERLHRQFMALRASGATPDLVLVGKMYGKSVGPHPKPQFEIQFLASALPEIDALIRPTGLTALIHPLTDDDLADHKTLGEWIGQPLPLDESVLDPPGQNQGIARFGKVDY